MTDFDREKARAVLREFVGAYVGDGEPQVLDALAACVVETTRAFDRGKARAVLRAVHADRDQIIWALDTLAEQCVVSTTLNIDRDALAQVFEDVLIVGNGTAARVQVDAAIDRVLALVRPAAGITITPDEAARLIGWYAALPVGVTSDDVELADRLKKAAS